MGGMNNRDSAPASAVRLARDFLLANREDYAAARASLLAESWGPVWRLAAGAGLPPFGPLHLPIPWTFQ